MIIFLALVFGLIIGSFLNVVIYRSDPAFSETMRRGRWRFGGRSFCLSCKKQLQWFELIPLVSFVIQKRQCLGCKGLISWQYPLVEFGTAVAFALVAWQYILGTFSF